MFAPPGGHLLAQAAEELLPADRPHVALHAEGPAQQPPGPARPGHHCGAAPAAGARRGTEPGLHHLHTQEHRPDRAAHRGHLQGTKHMSHTKTCLTHVRHGWFDKEELQGGKKRNREKRSFFSVGLLLATDRWCRPCGTSSTCWSTTWAWTTPLTSRRRRLGCCRWWPTAVRGMSICARSC